MSTDVFFDLAENVHGELSRSMMQRIQFYRSSYSIKQYYRKTSNVSNKQLL